MSDDLDQTPTAKSNVSSLESYVKNNIKLPWGRLYSTILYLDPVDLTKETFSVGRAEDCDVTITKSKFPQNRALNISKRHFTIMKEENCPPYLIDTSKNGTFINGKLIGKNNKCILQDDDEIAIGYKQLRAYIFKTVQSNEELYLPIELRTKYVLSRALGQGACGEVKLLLEKNTCKPFAVKRIKKAENMSKSYLLNHPSRIQNEIKIMQSLSHPCVIGVQEIVDTDQHVFIVLEYMDGGHLGDRIRSMNSLSEDLVKFLFYQMALAVQYLHQHGITHRDLKPDNVLLLSDAPKTQVKVSDFGLSKIVNEETVMRTLCGTPNYLAPEIWDTTCNSYDEKVDIWSMGVILFHMLARELPFQSDERSKLTKLIMSGKYEMKAEIWDSVSKDAKDLVQKMLTVDPKCRPSVDTVLKHPWIAHDFRLQLEVKQLMRRATNDTSKIIIEDEGTPPVAKRARFDTTLECTTTTLN